MQIIINPDQHYRSTESTIQMLLDKVARLEARLEELEKQPWTNTTRTAPTPVLNPLYPTYPLYPIGVRTDDGVLSVTFTGSVPPVYGAGSPFSIP